MSCTHSTGGCGCSHDHEETPAVASIVTEAPAADQSCCGGHRSERAAVDVGAQQDR